MTASGTTDIANSEEHALEGVGAESWHKRASHLVDPSGPRTRERTRQCVPATSKTTDSADDGRSPPRAVTGWQAPAAGDFGYRRRLPTDLDIEQRIRLQMGGPIRLSGRTARFETGPSHEPHRQRQQRHTPRATTDDRRGCRHPRRQRPTRSTAATGTTDHRHQGKPPHPLPP